MEKTELKRLAVQVDAVIEQIDARLPAHQAGAVAEFAAQFFAQVDPEDLEKLSVADLYGAVLSQWHFIARRKSGVSTVRVFNPRLDEHGWESAHTLVEIVGDDMPFLVDTVTMELIRQGFTLHLLIHPVLKVVRDADGVLLRLTDDSDADAQYESTMHLEVDRRSDEADLQALQQGLEQVLSDVRAAVSDWRLMRERMHDIIAGLLSTPASIEAEEAAEARDFLQWLTADNFVLLGCRDYALASAEDGDALHIVSGSGLGLLRAEGEDGQSRSFAALPPQLRAQAHVPGVLTVTKSNTRSTVHRPGYLDFIGVKTFDSEGRVSGERRVIGLLASTAYGTSPAHIPLLRRKVAAVIERADLPSGGHAAKTLQTIIERYPRDELFQITIDELYTQAMGILRLGERLRTRLFVRCDPFARFVSCLIYVPREHYNTDQRQRMQAVLVEAFDGSSSEFDVQFSDSALARIQIIVRTRDSVIPPFDVRELEQRLIRASRPWEDALRQALVEQCGEERGLALLRRYGKGFPAGYREDYSARMAVFDIEQIEGLGGAGELGMNLYRPLEGAADRINFRIYHLDASVPLSQSLPMLERMGVKVMDERPSEIVRQDGSVVWLHDFGLSFSAAETLNIHDIQPLFHDTFRRVWSGEVENDDFNRLVLLAGLSWREVSVLRAYAKHMRQAAFTFSQAYMEQALACYPQLTRQLYALFRARFDPALEADREAHCKDITAQIEASLNTVANLDEDRILRQFLAMIQATLRTNAFQRTADGSFKSWLSFKLSPARIPNLPQPLPMFEIFVYSPRLEGVHLRGGKVARGGLRWSDRMEDFRTEVLGLVKAQIVKNAVIVPVGSKGGFVVKNPPTEGGREALIAEGVACYQTFLRGLLDLTDNLVQGQVVPPVDVVRHDDDDPYLVVAADKGTASFSDYANEISAEYDFWLGDAFASGGSVGYDHKKMGITARGAWEAVKRHFREMGTDIQNQPFTVAGIGDMSGDVFGNGMLLSKHIRLVAAFDHRHIFIDPEPDAARSWEERARLFALPRSSWDDYDKALISEGGGVWARSAKSIKLSPQLRAVLDIEAEALAPVELIRAILCAPVDLVYNGGIGTYIKAASETDAAVGDRANDAVRVNGGALRCKVLGEGGNLGATQLGRIEFALKGGRVNTDAIDNSGGVDCSDHEVNIKILLNGVVAEGELTLKQRNQLLADMTDEVAALVLRDNYAQTQILALTRLRGVALLDEQAEFMRRLSHLGRLSRKLEFLPVDEDLAERKAARIGLTNPELAVLLAYSKIELYDEVLASDVPEDPYISTALERYFPAPLRTRFGGQIQHHALRREIISTHVVNSMVNRVGPTFAGRLKSEQGVRAPDVVRAYMATREVFGLVDVWAQIEALDNQLDHAVQVDLMSACDRLVQRASLWFLRHPEWLSDLQATLHHFSPGVAALAGDLLAVVGYAYRSELEATVTRAVGQGVPQALAERVAALDELYSALDLVEIAVETQRPEPFVARVYFGLGGDLELHWLGQQISALATESRWQVLARGALRSDLSALARSLTTNALQLTVDEDDAQQVMAAWYQRQGARLERYRQLLGDMRSAQSVDLAMVSVLLRELRGMS